MLEPDRIRLGHSDQGPEFRVAPAEPFNSPQWRELSNAGNETAFCFAWLALQCHQISGIMAGLLVVRDPGQDTPRITVRWPEREIDLVDLSRVVERAHFERRLVIAPGRIGPDTSPAQPVSTLVAVPLGAGSQLSAIAAVALTTSHGSPPVAPQTVADQLRWGAGWLEVLPWVRRLNDAASSTAQAAACLDLFAVIGEQPRFRGMAIAAVNDLATRLRCDRVSLGIVGRNGMVKMRAISHSATFKDQGRLVDNIENAMEEAVDQSRPIAYPPLPSTERAITIAHRALAELVKTPSASVMSVVLADSDGGLIGALTFERFSTVPFDKGVLQLAEAIAALLGPVVGLQLRANRLVAGRIVDRLGDGLLALIGPRRSSVKLGAVGVLVLLLALTFVKGEHRVTAKSVLEAEVQRAAVAPFEGFIRTASVRAGDTVHNGDILAALDDHDLVLDRLKWRAERDKLVQKQHDALAKHERTNIVVLESQIRQAQSQLALAEEKLSRAQIKAPFDGIVVSGDLSQMLGSPVEKGKTLFEIAPVDSYRLIVQVDEHDVRYVAVGQNGTVALAGAPGKPLPLVLSKITPVTVAEEGQNTYRIEARLTDLGPHLRPGMEGIAKIQAGQQPLVWIWTHRVIETLRLAAWKYLP